jgi:pimeloyl-ACP methyl ester carboxylesterase
MRITWKVLIITLEVLVLSIGAFPQLPTETTSPDLDSAPQLWGNLHPGRYAVGFRTIFRYDSSRTWKTTRGYNGTFSPDLKGRPIQINVWYPASPNRSATKMRFGDYVDQSAPEDFAALNTIMKQRSRDDAASSVPSAEIPALRSAQMNAYRDALSEKGIFPVVLYFGGLNAPINSNAILGEYLASQGYIVASISLLGPSEEQAFQSRTPEDLESSVRDMEFAWSILQGEPNIDKSKVAVLGHSVGAIEAVILGLRNADVSAVIALDGTYGFQGLSSVLTHSYGYAPEKMRASFLDLRRAQGAQGNEPLDLSAVDSFRHADRTLITLAKMHHSDFTSFAMIGAEFHTPLPTSYPLNGWNRETGRAGYQKVCKIVLSFLNANVKSDLNALGEIDRLAQQNEGISVKHLGAVAPPPSPLEAAALANTNGLEAAKRAFITSCGEDNLTSCMDADRFNTWGYNLLGQRRPKDALAVFQLNAWAHPQSANAQDSLADGYLSVNERENARTAVQRAIALVPTDETLDPAAKSSFLSDEKAKLMAIQ